MNEETDAVPNRLSITDQSFEYCQKWDVYFNGMKQRHCTIADVERGYIVRYRLGVGGIPIANRKGKVETVRCVGVVKIVPKGQEVALNPFKKAKSESFDES